MSFGAGLVLVILANLDYDKAKFWNTLKLSKTSSRRYDSTVEFQFEAQFEKNEAK